jgi:methyl-accepting chemotaxis protein/hemerythrin
MTEFIWKDEYSVGVADIDFQHKRLMEAISDLSEAINTQTVEKEIEHVLNQLDSYVSHHFSTEELYFERFNYAGAKEHVIFHRDFAAKIAEFREKYEKHEVEISGDLIKFLEDWLLDHMLNVDRKYMECFAKNGLK